MADVLEGTEVAPSAELATVRVRLDLDGIPVLLEDECIDLRRLPA